MFEKIAQVSYWESTVCTPALTMQSFNSGPINISLFDNKLAQQTVRKTKDSEIVCEFLEQPCFCFAASMK